MNLHEAYDMMFNKNSKKTDDSFVEDDMVRDIDYYLNKPGGKEQMLEIVHDFVENCNYNDIHKAMVALDWYWATLPDNGIPTEEDLKADLLDKFLRLFEEKCDRLSSGGFTVGYNIVERHPYEPDDFEHCVDVYYYFAVDDGSSIL